MPPDSELVGAYVADRSESAFRTLVARHADLVYGTALRQVGDRGVAEEITQNVFITLAKKAPRLAGMETLAGWLHRTAIFESKARIRSDLRRRTREDAAAALAALERDGEGSVEELVPLLDEALLHLREGDRIALMLRFFESQSMREVGTALGVDEDAARKRVSRALERVVEFFRQRGFAVPAGTGIEVILTNSAQSAPVGLATTAATAGFAAGGTISALQVGLFYLMNLSGTKTVVGCLLLAAAPLLWQSNVEARLNSSVAAARQELKTLSTELEDTRSREQINETIGILQKETADAQSRLALLNAQRTGQAPRPTYRWDDNSPYMRVPKQYLASLPLAVYQKGRAIEIADVVTEFLQMTPDDHRRVRAALQDFYDRYEKVLVGKVRLVEPTKEELRTYKPEDTRVFEISEAKEEIRGLRPVLFAELKTVLGAERFEVFREKMGDWMPVDEEFHGINSGVAVLQVAHRRGFHRKFFREPGEVPTMAYQLNVPGRGSFYHVVPVDQIPQPIAAQLQDWIAEAHASEDTEEE